MLPIIHTSKLNNDQRCGHNKSLQPSGDPDTKNVTLSTYPSSLPSTSKSIGTSCVMNSTAFFKRVCSRIVAFASVYPFGFVCAL